MYFVFYERDYAGWDYYSGNDITAKDSGIKKFSDENEAIRFAKVFLKRPSFSYSRCILIKPSSYAMVEKPNQRRA